MLNFDRFTVKHGTQNIQNDCHQWLSDSLRVHQIRFCPGSIALDPTGGAYSAPLDSLAGLRGPTSVGEGRGGKGERKRGREEEEKEKDRPPPSQIPGSAPALTVCVVSRLCPVYFM